MIHIRELCSYSQQSIQLSIRALRYGVCALQFYSSQFLQAKVYIRSCYQGYLSWTAVKSIAIAGHTRQLISSFGSMCAERLMVAVEALPMIPPLEVPLEHPGPTVLEQIHLWCHPNAVTFLACQEKWA